jgi:uncharacterized protein DUF4180
LNDTCEAGSGSKTASATAQRRFTAMTESEIANDVLDVVEGVRILICAVDGPRISGERDINDVVSAAWQHQATMVAIPVQRLDPAFFRLSSRIAGEVLQKLVNYRLRPVIVGDVSTWSVESGALRDFILESNRGHSVWFVEDLDELRRRLASTK